MASLGNADAVRRGNEKEGRPARPAPARETAEARVAATPERAEKPAAPRKLTEMEERAEDLRRAIPGISDDAIATMLKQYQPR